jgi:hypothetical protein
VSSPGDRQPAGSAACSVARRHARVNQTNARARRRGGERGEWWR